LLDHIVRSKKDLEFLLEKIPRYSKPKRELEQYETPSHIVAHILWFSLLRGDVTGRTIVDLGCGTARFAIGALILGASRAYCIDVDPDIILFSAMSVKNIYTSIYNRLIHVVCDIRDLEMMGVDTVFMNPPFGVFHGNRGIDMIFLKKALMMSNSVYTIHKYSPGVDKLVYEISSVFGFKITYREVFDFPIPMMFNTHRRRIYRFKAVLYVLNRMV